MSLRDRLELLRRQSGASEPAAAVSAPPGAASSAAEPAAEPTGPVAQRATQVAQPATQVPADDVPAEAAACPLQQAALPRPSAPEPTAAPSLAERLRRLNGGAAPVAGPRRPERADDAALAQLLEGQTLAPGVILTERRLPLAGELHGRFALPRIVELVRGLPEGPIDPTGLVFFDTETTGLSGGTGTVAFLLGLGRIVDGALVVRQYILTTFGGEAELLAAAGDWAAGAEGVVTFNGKSFDVPLVATRCRMAGVADRFSPLPHIDLLPPTRRAFGRQWSDCRLGTAERKLLHFEREDDLPGSEAPESWFAWVRRGDASRLPQVARHNHLDIVSLAALLPALGDAHAEPARWRADVLGVARAYARAGAEARAFQLLGEHRALLTPDGLFELAVYHRRRGEWDEARALWEPLAAEGHLPAVECLAKYHEHVRRDFACALTLADRLQADPDRERRRERLLRKLGCAGAAGAAGTSD